MSVKVVFWDIDGTMLPGSLEKHFFKYLRENHHTTLFKSLINLLVLYTTLQMPDWYEVKLCYLKDLKVSDVDKIVDECFEKMIKNDIYPSINHAVEFLNTKNIRQVIISGTFKPLAEKLAELLSIKDIIVAKPQISNGRYIGGLAKHHPQGIWKVKYAADWLNENKLEWSESIAIADNFADRFLLAKSAKAIVINPESKLRNYAFEQKWDIFYEIKNKEKMKQLLESNLA